MENYKPSSKNDLVNSQINEILHHYLEDGAIELYNLEKDLSENNNLAIKKPQKVNQLLNMLTECRKSTNAAVPTKLNPMYQKLE